MKFNDSWMQLGVAILSMVFTINAVHAEKVNQKRQVGNDKGLVLDTTEDRAAEATGFHDHGGHHHHHSKYFQYAHVPHHDHYETGHRKGNEHHFIERHEKAHPHAGEFKTKVRWGDKHGGYGEHYWDYNHAGHGHGHDSHDEGSEAVPEYKSYKDDEQNRKKRQPSPAAGPSLVLDAETGEIIDQVTGRKYILKPIN